MSQRPFEGEFKWDQFQQSVILSAFFWGYLVFQVSTGFKGVC